MNTKRYCKKIDKTIRASLGRTCRVLAFDETPYIVRVDEILVPTGGMQDKTLAIRSCLWRTGYSTYTATGVFTNISSIEPVESSAFSFLTSI